MKFDINPKYVEMYLVTFMRTQKKYMNINGNANKIIM